ncbi:bile acid:sodium symporter family protein [Actinomycetospora callitridis]|uniref:bile acid:sodium symporter family protein n=1 Tax=Actinomycetospora callitridis TaxID=913944 RepID=UPI002365BB86|nr:bile acid:sodium symporter family protein [Actinomycetospora callitridis]MDD7920974.1 bile acid:sodium symporter family protein [Actinomycetospora callitridis]
MDSALTTVGLPAALAVVMLGLGLSLTVGDFGRVARRPVAVVAALVTQLVVLPVICFGLVIAAGLDPLLAVGTMLLAASPGGTTANLFSHLFRGDVALNITLTAVNSVIAVITLPVVVNLSLAYFRPVVEGGLGLDLSKTAQVFAVVLVPVVIGMLIRRASPTFADRADRPVRILSAVVLVVVIVGALLGERENLGEYLAAIGLVAAAFCLISLTLGYLVPRLLRVGHPQAVASAFEVGIHNSTLAIAVAVSVLQTERLAVPAAVYGVLMFPLAVGAGALLRRLAPRTASVPDDEVGSSRTLS